MNATSRSGLNDLKRLCGTVANWQGVAGRVAFSADTKSTRHVKEDKHGSSTMATAVVGLATRSVECGITRRRRWPKRSAVAAAHSRRCRGGSGMERPDRNG